MEEFEILDTPLLEVLDVWQLLFRFAFKSIVVWVIIHWL